MGGDDPLLIPPQRLPRIPPTRKPKEGQKRPLGSGFLQAWGGGGKQDILSVAPACRLACRAKACVLLYLSLVGLGGHHWCSLVVYSALHTPQTFYRFL